MSKLYLSADTDARRGTLTSRAHKWINTAVGYDEKHINKQVRFNVFREPNGELLVQLFDADNKKIMVECKGNDREGLLSCDVRKP